ncbi:MULTISPECIES: YggT family protein [unclassified Pseudoalteromonas]|uniref:YggT family protein n=1 Tax=unclassified Pseudoalteromonas TaxID=194690 RepID=UPI000CF71DC1|nr:MULTISPECIES: YggT family protein [unclassified Pseudoalteromonas]MBS3798243.1 YggT family protein [Pseudoalteromonas sp. BDTF-M6]
MNSVHFLVGILFDLFLMVVLLRFWLQAARADFYNPLSQFVVKATSFAVNPLRKVIPGFAGLDIASLVLAFIVAFAKVTTLLLMFGEGWNTTLVLMGGVFTLIREALQLLFWVLIIRAILSWVSQGYNPIEAIFHQLTEPMLRPIRKVIPPIGGLDLSILVLIIALQFLQFLLMDLTR